jgi:hypothetical protein
MAKNPVEEFLLEKRALNLSGALQKAAPVARRVGETAGNAALAGAGAAAFAGLTGAAGKLYMAATKSRDFKNMLEANPDLHEHLEQDPAGFNRLFTSLRTFAPDFTQDPLVAGTYMRNGFYNTADQRGSTAVRAMADLKPRRMGPVSEEAIKGFTGGMKLPPAEGKRQQLMKQTKSTFNHPGDGGDPQLSRIEETQNYYG